MTGNSGGASGLGYLFRREPPDMPRSGQCTASRQNNHNDCTDRGGRPNHRTCCCH